MHKPPFTILHLCSAILACTPGCYGNIQRSARVPHPAVAQASGQPMTTPADITLGASSLKDFVAPTAADVGQAVEVPGTQLRGELRFRPSKKSSAFFGLIYERGLGSTTQIPDETQAPVGPGDVLGLGALVGGSFSAGVPGLRVGVVTELMTWEVPYVEYTIVTEGPVKGLQTIDRGTDSVATLGIGISPTYKANKLTVFGGLFGRNHPTTKRKESGSTFANGGDVENGPLNLLANIGASYDLSDHILGTLIINQNLIANPVQYGPGIQLSLTAKLGDEI
jgi:hypothetical protein